jgi:hypothetical protein
MTMGDPGYPQYLHVSGSALPSPTEHTCGPVRSWVTPAPDPLCDGTGLKSMLLTTSDGGHTWTPIGQ